VRTDTFYPLFRNCGDCHGFIFNSDSPTAQQLGVCGCAVALEMEMASVRAKHPPFPEKNNTMTVKLNEDVMRKARSPQSDEVIHLCTNLLRDAPSPADGRPQAGAAFARRTAQEAF